MNKIETCVFEAPRYKLLTSCSNQLAQYIYTEYRFIPIDSTVRFVMCDDVSHATINADNYQYGIIKSRSYPTWEENMDMKKEIVSQNPNKAIKFYLTDIDITDEIYQTGCTTDYIELSDVSEISL